MSSALESRTGKVYCTAAEHRLILCTTFCIVKRMPLFSSKLCLPKVEGKAYYTNELYFFLTCAKQKEKLPGMCDLHMWSVSHICTANLWGFISRDKKKYLSLELLWWSWNFRLSHSLFSTFHPIVCQTLFSYLQTQLNAFTFQLASEFQWNCCIIVTLWTALLCTRHPATHFKLLFFLKRHYFCWSDQK